MPGGPPTVAFRGSSLGSCFGCALISWVTIRPGRSAAGLVEGDGVGGGVGAHWPGVIEADGDLAVAASSDLGVALELCPAVAYGLVDLGVDDAGLGVEGIAGIWIVGVA